MNLTPFYFGAKRAAQLEGIERALEDSVVLHGNELIEDLLGAAEEDAE